LVGYVLAENGDDVKEIVIEQKIISKDMIIRVAKVSPVNNRATYVRELRRRTVEVEKSTKHMEYMRNALEEWDKNQ